MSWRSWILAALVVPVVLLVPSAAEATLVYQRTANDQLVAARNDGTRPHVIAKPNRPAREIAVSPDGRWVAYLLVDSPLNPDSAAGRLYVVKMAGGRPRLMLRKNIAVVYPFVSVQWSANSRDIVVGDDDSFKAHLLDVATGRDTPIGLGGPFAGATFSPNGALLALAWSSPGGPGSPASDLVSYDLRSRRRLADFPDGGGPLWGRGGLAYGDDAGLKVAYRRTTTTRGPLLPPPSAGCCLDPLAWTKDGRHLLAAEGLPASPFTATVLTIANGNKTRFPESFDEVNGVSRDGKRVLGVIAHNVVVATADGRVRLLARHARSASWNE